MVILPTLNRIEKCRRFLKSYADTNNELPGRLLVDKDDWNKNQNEYVKINNLHLPKNWAIEITDAVTMGGKCREYVPKLPAESKYVLILNDDHLCISNKCLEILVSKLDGKNFVAANDRRIQCFSFPVTATAWSIPLLQCLGWPIYPPFLEHMYIDNLWHELAKATGCGRYPIASAVVEHEHVIFGRAEADDTHNKVYGEKWLSSGGVEKGELWKKDEENFNIFMRTEFGKAVEMIKRFQDYMPGEQWNPKVSNGQSPKTN